MKIFRRIIELRAYLKQEQNKNKSVGLVPTMGALHAGHAGLVKKSVEDQDISVVSIFVNPTQFNNPEDLKKYPNREVGDIELLEKHQCDVLFIPSVSEMYPDDSGDLKINFGEIETLLEGEFRPRHFSGVGIVVSKLLNIVQPNVAYFGQKDLQQLAIIKMLVKELNMPINIVGVPTVREQSGLAMSSRNLRLTIEEKEVASRLYSELRLLRKNILTNGLINQERAIIIRNLNEIDGLSLEYLEVVDSMSMKGIERLSDADQISICAAAFVGEVRIIDNIYL